MMLYRVAEACPKYHHFQKNSKYAGMRACVDITPLVTDVVSEQIAVLS